MAFDDTVPIKPLDPNYKPPAKDGPEAKKAETGADTVPLKPLDPNLADTVPLKPLDPNYKPLAKEAPKKAEAPVAPVKPAPAAKVPPPAPKTEPPPRIEPTLKDEPAAKVEPAGFKAETAAEAWLGLLATRGIEYLFANGGTDFGPVVEAYAKVQSLVWRLPQVVIVPH